MRVYVKKRTKWKKTEGGGWTNVDVDANIWCPCDTDNNRTLYCQNGRETTCPSCGRVFRVITRVTIQEKVVEL